MAAISESAYRLPPSHEVVGVNVSCISAKETVLLLESVIRVGDRIQCCTVNACSVTMAHRDPELNRIYERAGLVVCDGAGVLWALKRQGVEGVRVTGIELLERLAERSQLTGHRIFLLGAAPRRAEAAKKHLLAKFPGCQIVGTHHGFYAPENESEVVDIIRASKPDILFVAMGVPKQEKFIAQYQDQLRIPVAMGVGGAFDVLSGSVRRAPRWIQSIGMEWFWRMILQPSRIPRIKDLITFVGLVLRTPIRRKS